MPPGLGPVKSSAGLWLEGPRVASPPGGLRVWKVRAWCDRSCSFVCLPQLPWTGALGYGQTSAVPLPEYGGRGERKFTCVAPTPLRGRYWN